MYHLSLRTRSAHPHLRSNASHALPHRTTVRLLFGWIQPQQAARTLNFGFHATYIIMGPLLTEQASLLYPELWEGIRHPIQFDAWSQQVWAEGVEGIRADRRGREDASPLDP